MVLIVVRFEFIFFVIISSDFPHLLSFEDFYLIRNCFYSDHFAVAMPDSIIPPNIM